MPFFRSIRLVLIACSAGLLLGAAWGQNRNRNTPALNCGVDQVIKFVDGRSACLAELPALGQFQPADERSPLAEIARQRRTWSLWAAATASCGPAFGFHHRPTPSEIGDQVLRNAEAVRLAAREQCESRLSNGACECIELAASGASSLSHDRFDALFAGIASGAASATGASPLSGQAVRPPPGDSGAAGSGTLALLGRLIPGATAPRSDAGRSDNARAPGASCSIDQLITFPGGRNACLSDLTALAQLLPAGERTPLTEIARQRRIWSLWAAETPACEGAYGFDHVATPVNNTDLVLRTTEDVQASARQRCEAKVQGRACECVEVVTTGTAAVSRAQFDVLTASITGAPVPQAEPATTAQAAQPTAPSPPNRARPATGNPAPATAARPDSETEQLRKELAALRQEMAEGNRSRASTDASASASAEAAGRPRVRALVIGNGNYRYFGRLANPVNDARAMAAKLSGFGIDVQTVFDADRDSFIRALNSYAERSRPGDIGILFYAGHGVQVDGINYLVPINMQADGVSAGYIKLSGISLNDVIGYMPATTRLIFLDACRDNPATRALVAARSTSVGIGLAPVNTATGTLISYATRDGGVAEDGKGANSPYTSALLRHLDARQDIALVLRQVRQTVMRMTGDRQQPWEYGSLVGDQLILSQVARP